MPDLTELRTDEHKDFASDLDEIAREGARRMLAQALEAEVADYIARNQERDENGPRPGRPQRQGAPQEGDAGLRHDRSPRAAGR